MGRHTNDYKYIDKFFTRDKLAFNALSKTGHMTAGQFKSFNIADSRLKNYARDGLVEKVPYKMKGGKSGEAYKFTKAGKQIAEQNWGIKNHYHAQSALHDIAIADKFISLKEEQQWSWKTEEMARERVEEIIQETKDQGDEETAKMYEDMLNNNLISMPDAIYTNDQGVEVAFEVITRNYGETELVAKEAAVQILGVDYETTRV
jgi:hypothetical protein